MGRIAITGANGFLGSHLVKEALSQGHEVIALVREQANLALLPTAQKLSVQQINYQDDSLAKTIADLGEIDLFVHNAGLTSTLRKNDYYRVNTELTSRLLEEIKASNSLSGEGKFIFVSSLAAKGPSGAGKAVSHYGVSKIQAEASVRASGLDYLIFRPAGIYGPGDKAFIPIFKAAKRRLYLSISRKSQKITLIHGADAAHTILTLASKLTNKIVTLTDGNVYGHRDLAKALQRERPMRFISIPPFIVRGAIGCIELIHRLLGKNPALTLEKYREISGDWDVIHDDVEKTALYIRYSLEEGFSETYDHYQNQGLI